MPATSAARWSILCDARGVCRCVWPVAVGDLRFGGDECGTRRGAAGDGARPLVPNPAQHRDLVSALRYTFRVCCLCTCTAVAAGAALRWCDTDMPCSECCVWGFGYGVVDVVLSLFSRWPCRLALSSPPTCRWVCALVPCTWEDRRVFFASLVPCGDRRLSGVQALGSPRAVHSATLFQRCLLFAPPFSRLSHVFISSLFFWDVVANIGPRRLCRCGCIQL